MSQYLPAVDIYNYTPSLCVYNTPHHRHQLLLHIFKQREVRKYFYLFSFHRDKNVNISTPSQSSYLLSWVSEELLGNVFQRKQMCSLPCAGLSLKHALKLLKNNKIFTVPSPSTPRGVEKQNVWTCIVAIRLGAVRPMFVSAGPHFSVIFQNISGAIFQIFTPQCAPRLFPLSSSDWAELEQCSSNSRYKNVIKGQISSHAPLPPPLTPATEYKCVETSPPEMICLVLTPDLFNFHFRTQ